MPATKSPRLNIASRKWKQKLQAREEQVHSGVSARFVRISKDWGLKCFRYKRVAAVCYVAQKEAAKLGLGPEVGEFGKTQHGWGFVTEFAESWGEREELPECYSQELERAEDEMYENEDYNQLLRDLRAAGFMTADMHIFNVGFTNEGKLVAIDFDREAVCRQVFEWVPDLNTVIYGAASVKF